MKLKTEKITYPELLLAGHVVARYIKSCRRKGNQFKQGSRNLHGAKIVILQTCNHTRGGIMLQDMLRKSLHGGCGPVLDKDPLTLLVTRNKNGNIVSFTSEKVSVENVKNELDGLNTSKSTTFKSVPPKLLKSESKLVSTPLQIIFNNSIEQSSFSDELKLADVSSLFKKEVKTFTVSIA